jgi:uncharacterized protein YndB with AHSA1/START domain
MTEHPPGTITLDGDVATLTFERWLPFPVEAVWAALTEPGERKSWFGETTLEPRTGGTIEMMPEDPPAEPDAKRMTGRILVWEPPRVLEHEWRQRIVDDSVVRYELTPEGEGTRLVFTHRGLSERNALGFAPGSHAFFDRLEAHLAGEEIPNWSARYTELAPAYPSWR